MGAENWSSPKDLEGFAEEVEMRCMIPQAGNTWEFPCPAAARCIWGGKGPRSWG